MLAYAKPLFTHMAEGKTIRLSQAARKLNVGTATIVAHLKAQGESVENKPNAKLTDEQFKALSKAFSSAATEKEEASEITIGESYANTPVLTAEPTASDWPRNAPATPERHQTQVPQLPGLKMLGKSSPRSSAAPAPSTTALTREHADKHQPQKTLASSQPTSSPQHIRASRQEDLKGLTVLGKIKLPESQGKFLQVASSDATKKPDGVIPVKRTKGKKTRVQDRYQGQESGAVISEQEIQEHIRNTLAKLSKGNARDTRRAKYRKAKRVDAVEAQEAQEAHAQEEAKNLRLTEFISVSDLASLMGVAVNDVISTCMTLGMTVSINQRLDAEAITVVADEFGYTVSFADVQEDTEEEEDQPDTLVERAPIVTIMGHVDHGKTSLLDYIRNTQIIKQEAGGITQHIGAYDVTTSTGKRIAFLDTPGHEAFTAMRARGAKLTDIAIIVVAADDRVMPQTKEAINHAKVAGVPIVIAINKIDKSEADPERIKKELAGVDVLVEEWGGKYQSQAISARTGQGIEELLEKVLFESDLLELKANPNRNASGTVVEASLDPGKGYMATIMIQHGTLRVGEMLLAGAYYGRVKAMTNHLGHRLDQVPPATPVQVLGLNGAPQAGDKVRVMDSDRDAREIALRREQILREQTLRTKRHITLDEIGRRLAVGSFKELNVILRCDTDGSAEALADSLLKLSTEEVQVNIVQKGVGAVSESDVLLASAVDAVIIGFQVRPSSTVRKLAEKESIEIRLYAIIYEVINDIKDAMQGMLAPTIEEVVTGSAVVRQVFKISRVGTIAGAYMTEGYLKRNSQVRVVREGVVVYTGKIDQLKRFKEDVTEVKKGFEFGASIGNFNDIKAEDVLEGFEQKEVARKL